MYILYVGADHSMEKRKKTFIHKYQLFVKVTKKTQIFHIVYKPERATLQFIAFLAHFYEDLELNLFLGDALT